MTLTTIFANEFQGYQQLSYAMETMKGCLGVNHS